MTGTLPPLHSRLPLLLLLILRLLLHTPPSFAFISIRRRNGSLGGGSILNTASTSLPPSDWLHPASQYSPPSSPSLPRSCRSSLALSAPPLATSPTILSKWLQSKLLSSKKHNNVYETEPDEFANNPDLAGVYVDGFPLPPTPTRIDDDELLASLRRVPLKRLDEMQHPLLRRPLGTLDAISANTRNATNTTDTTNITNTQPLRIIIAGGGLGGLALASTLIQSGHDVHVLEQAKEYKPFGGPIQIQSNALWALREIHPALYEAVEECGVRTGDRLSGIKDGKRYNEGWLVKFDAATPAKKCNLPLTLAINRVALQEIFLKYGVPRERVHTDCRVVGYENVVNRASTANAAEDLAGALAEGANGVKVILENGDHIYGDILIGSDGIWSKIKHQMYGLPPNESGPSFATKHARYSGYTCFTGTCQHTPADIDSVAYKVFLGQEQYLGCTDCGHGWQHWWAFLPDPPGNSGNTSTTGTAPNNENDDEPMLDHLRREFEGWSPEIHDLFHATKPEVVKRRDLFDRLPLWKGWTDGNVALLGDAAHPTMPNLGQGGAMAIEDAYVLGKELEGIRHTDEIPERLKKYERRRFVRASIAQFLSRNGSDLLVDWEKLRNTPIVGPMAMFMINAVQPITMNYLYSSKF